MHRNTSSFVRINVVSAVPFHLKYDGTTSMDHLHSNSGRRFYDLVLVLASRSPKYPSVSLKECTHVRSLTVAQLEDEERIFPPRNDGTNELKLFELVFRDKEKEKFTTASVRQRANWVSAI